MQIKPCDLPFHLQIPMVMFRMCCPLWALMPVIWRIPCVGDRAGPGTSMAHGVRVVYRVCREDIPVQSMLFYFVNCHYVLVNSLHTAVVSCCKPVVCRESRVGQCSLDEIIECGCCSVWAIPKLNMNSWLHPITIKFPKKFSNQRISWLFAAVSFKLSANTWLQLPLTLPVSNSHIRSG